MLNILFHYIILLPENDRAGKKAFFAREGAFFRHNHPVRITLYAAYMLSPDCLSAPVRSFLKPEVMKKFLQSIYYHSCSNAQLWKDP